MIQWIEIGITPEIVETQSLMGKDFRSEGSVANENLSDFPHLSHFLNWTGYVELCRNSGRCLSCSAYIFSEVEGTYTREAKLTKVGPYWELQATIIPHRGLAEDQGWGNGDNRPENLCALCINCHAEQFPHQHIRSNPRYQVFLR